MGLITTDQSHQVMSTLATNVDWKSIDFWASGLQDLIIRNPKEVGRQFTAFLKNGGKVIVGEPKVITINRGCFNPAKFICDGWSILEDETDTRSTALTKLDLTKVQQVTMLKSGENVVNGKERLKRLKKDGHICLDAEVFLTLRQSQLLIPESWKEKVNGNTRYIFFDGTILRRSDGYRFVLCLYWNDVAWRWLVDWLGNNWDDNDLSAVLAS